MKFTGRPEAYVDQSRVINVNLGPPDIRTSMLKQRMFLNQSVFFMKEEQQGHRILGRLLIKKNTCPFFRRDESLLKT